MDDHLTATRSDRGFDRLPPVPSRHGGEVQVYESSAASGPHLWLSVQTPVDLNDPEGPVVDAVAHLTVEDALKLAEQIQQLAAGHYQNG